MSRMRFRTWIWGAISGALGASCGGHEAPPTTQSDIAHIALARECSASAGAKRLAPAGSRGTGSTVALATFSGRSIALVADEDDRAIQIVDLDTNRRIGRTELGGVPGQ